MIFLPKTEMCRQFHRSFLAVTSTAYRIVLITMLSWTSLTGVASAQIVGDSLPLVFEDGNGNTLLYRLFLPPGHDEPGAKFPLVLYMHGSNQTGTDNVSQLQTVDGLVNATQNERFASFLLAPQVQPGQGGWGPFTRGMTLQVMQQIEQQYAVDTERRYVTGLSMGGFGTWGFVADHPELFEAAVPMSSWGDPSRADQYLQTRLWSFHGRSDSLLAQYDREMIAAIHEAGGSPLYTETIGGHAIWRPIYNDPIDELYAWMFEGVPPPLATLHYNPQDGSVKIDADVAPGGAIKAFNLLFEPGVLSIPSTIVVDGTIVGTSSFFNTVNDQELLYAASDGIGFSGELDLGPLLPTGLDFLTLHEIVTRQFYQTSATRRLRRYFSLVIAVPEPSSLLLLSFGAAIVALRRRKLVV